jgi:hypothetical protein
MTYWVDFRTYSRTTVGERSGTQRLQPDPETAAAIERCVAAGKEHGGTVDESIKERHESSAERHHRETGGGMFPGPRHFDMFPPEVFETIRQYIVSMGTASGLLAYLNTVKLFFPTSSSSGTATITVQVGDTRIEVRDRRDLDVALEAAERLKRLEPPRTESPP